MRGLRDKKIQWEFFSRSQDLSCSDWNFRGLPNGCWYHHHHSLRNAWCWYVREWKKATEINIGDSPPLFWPPRVPFLIPCVNKQRMYCILQFLLLLLLFFMFLFFFLSSLLHNSGLWNAFESRSRDFREEKDGKFTAGLRVPWILVSFSNLSATLYC